MAHTLLDSRHTASHARRATWAIYALIRPRFLCCDFAGPIHLPVASSCRASIRESRPASSFPREMTLENGRNHSLHARNGANIPASPYGLGDLERMEHAKLANGSGHELPIGRPPSPQDLVHAARSTGKKAIRKKAELAPRKAKPARPLRKDMGSKSKSNKLVCRYCGSDDLAPSFIKRRDRRCRKCFSKRYGSVARARKAKVKK